MMFHIAILTLLAISAACGQATDPDKPITTKPVEAPAPRPVPSPPALPLPCALPPAHAPSPTPLRGRVLKSFLIPSMIASRPTLERQEAQEMLIHFFNQYESPPYSLGEAMMLERTGHLHKEDVRNQYEAPQYDYREALRLWKARHTNLNRARLERLQELKRREKRRLREMDKPKNCPAVPAVDPVA